MQLNTSGVSETKLLHQHFGEDILRVEAKSVKRAVVTVNHKFRFIIASALETAEGIEILYHFSLDSTGLILSLRVILEKANPTVESLTGLFEAANWIEREMHEILGIKFLNHPNLEKLISDGNWAEGVYPYRSDK